METNSVIMGIGLMIYAFNQAGNWFTKFKQNGKPHDQYQQLIARHIEVQEKQNAVLNKLLEKLP